MKKLLLLMHVVFLIQYSALAQFGCFGNPSLEGNDNVCPGTYQTYKTNADIGRLRFDFTEWETNSGNSITRINGTETLFYTEQYLVTQRSNSGTTGSASSLLSAKNLL